MGYLDYAGLQYLWGKLKEKFAPKSHNHDDRYYTESEMDGKLNSKVNNNEAGANGLLSKLSVWTATPTDDTYFMRQDTGGGNSFGRVKFSTIWSYIKGKADGLYQPKGSYAASNHNHDDRYYTEAEIDGKLAWKAESIVLAKNANLNNITTPGFYSCGGSNSISNKPSGTDAIGLIVTHNAGGSFYTQILTTSANANTYRRTCLNGAWSEWTQDKYTDTNTWRGIQNNLTSDSTSDSLSAAQGKVLKGLVDGKAPNGHTHTKSQVGLGNVDNTADANKSVKYATSAGTSNSCTGNAATATGIKDYGDTNKTIKIGYAGAGLTTSNLTHIAGYASNGTQIKDVSKDVLKSWIGLGNYLSLSGGTMSGQITFSDHSHGKIYSGPTDNVNGPGGDLNNIVIESWNGLSFTTGCPNQTYTGKTAVGIDCREGVVKAARFDGTLTGTAATLGGGGNPYAPMTFNWSGKDGQPIWLWGGNDGVNMYVYNPSNFKVNWAQSAANGVYTNGFNGSGGYIRFCNGVQICWGRTNCSGNDTTINFSAAFSDSSYSVSTMPFYFNFAGTYWNVKEGSMGTTSFVLHGSKSSIDLRTMLWIAIGKWN